MATEGEDIAKIKVSLKGADFSWIRVLSVDRRETRMHIVIPAVRSNNGLWIVKKLYRI